MAVPIKSLSVIISLLSKSIRSLIFLLSSSVTNISILPQSSWISDEVTILLPSNSISLNIWLRRRFCLQFMRISCTVIINKTLVFIAIAIFIHIHMHIHTYTRAIQGIYGHLLGSHWAYHIQWMVTLRYSSYYLQTLPSCHPHQPK